MSSYSEKPIKKIISRFILKRGTADQWKAASDDNYIPELGEPIFYQQQKGKTLSNVLKVGDGKNTPDNLPPLTFYEAWLQSGGGNFSASYSPIDRALLPTLSANRLAYSKPAGIAVMYSRDGGATWLDYGLTDLNKVRLVTNKNLTSIVSGKGTKTDNANLLDSDQFLVSVTLTAADMGVYSNLDKFIIYASTDGFTDTWCTIEQEIANNLGTWKMVTDKAPISGWADFNVINTTPMLFGGTDTDRTTAIRLTFGGVGNSKYSTYAGLSIKSIQAIGGVGWTAPSELARSGVPYSYDSSATLDANGKPIPITTFPGTLQATTFVGALTGNASTATKATEAEHATTADTATNATNATNAAKATKAITATSASSAASAVKATKDGAGNTITTTYATKTELSNLISYGTKDPNSTVTTPFYVKII